MLVAGAVLIIVLATGILTRNPTAPASYDVAAAVKDNATWQGGHIALVLSEHGYVT